MRNRHFYPDNWDALSLSIREAADWTCQGCQRTCRRAGEPVSAFIARAFDLRQEGWKEAIAHPIRFTLTVAHLNHDPGDCRRENLRALCSACHLRYDAVHHAKSRASNRMRRLEAQGQKTLFDK